MYKILTINSRIRVPPELFGKNVEEAVSDAIRKSYEGVLDKVHGLFLALTKINEIGEGIIIPGDGAIYYNVVFEILVYKPELHEVVEGKVSEIAEYGAFIKIGPLDGLVHISQVMDDFVSYSKSQSLAGKQTKRTLKLNDVVLARVIAISLRSLQDAKIGLTMRQPYLGKMEWYEEKKKSEKK